MKRMLVDGEKTSLQIWDTAGQERFRSITQSYYRSANALILTYDITCEDSFRCLPEWLREIEQYANNQVVTILVGKRLLLCSFSTVEPPSGSLFTVRITELILEAVSESIRKRQSQFCVC